MRATTIIFEEDGAEPATSVNLVQPNRPHASSLQVEEVGSFIISKQEESVSYHHQIPGTPTQGIIQEADSEENIKFNRTTSRGISITSATSDEDAKGQGIYSRDIAVDEIQENIPFEDGYAEVRLKTTTIEETQVIVADVEDAEEVPASKARRATIDNLEDEHNQRRRKSHLVDAVDTSVDDEDFSSTKQTATTKQNLVKQEQAEVDVWADRDTDTLPPKKKQQAKIWTAEEAEEKTVEADKGDIDFWADRDTDDIRPKKQRGQSFQIEEAEERQFSSKKDDDDIWADRDTDDIRHKKQNAKVWHTEEVEEKQFSSKKEDINIWGDDDDDNNFSKRKQRASLYDTGDVQEVEHDLGKSARKPSSPTSVSPKSKYAEEDFWADRDDDKIPEKVEWRSKFDENKSNEKLLETDDDCPKKQKASIEDDDNVSDLIKRIQKQKSLIEDMMEQTQKQKIEERKAQIAKLKSSIDDGGGQNRPEGIYYLNLVKIDLHYTLKD